MGPRPQPSRLPSAPAQRCPVEVVRLRSRHAPPADTEPLPEPVLGALRAIARDMRDVPRDCVIARAELLVWLRRLAGRVDGVAALRVTPARPKPKRAPAANVGPARAMSVREQAEVVFGNTPKPGAKLVERRTVTSRKGRAVPVEVRRARQHGQMELW